jgi:hypothetical protein
MRAQKVLLTLGRYQFAIRHTPYLPKVSYVVELQEIARSLPTRRDFVCVRARAYAHDTYAPSSANCEIEPDLTAH